MSFGYLAFLAAGIGLVATLVILFFNDFLLKHKLSVIEPEQILGHALNVQHTELVRREGVIALFTASWLTALGYLILWLTPFYQAYSYGSPWLASFTYSFCAWLVLMLLVFPVLHKGFFGLAHHEDAAASTALLCIVYSLVLVAATYLI